MSLKVLELNSFDLFSFFLIVCFKSSLYVADHVNERLACSFSKAFVFFYPLFLLYMLQSITNLQVCYIYIYVLLQGPQGQIFYIHEEEGSLVKLVPDVEIIECCDLHNPFASHATKLPYCKPGGEYFVWVEAMQKRVLVGKINPYKNKGK